MLGRRWAVTVVQQAYAVPIEAATSEAETILLACMRTRTQINFLHRNSNMTSKVATTISLAFVGALLVVPTANSLVAVPLPGRNANTGWKIPRNEPSAHYQKESKTAGTSTTVIVRKTTKEDIQQISSLLAAASVCDDADALNWNTKMQILRDESTYKKQLSQRMDVLEAGRKAAQRARPALVEAGLIDENEEECSIDDDHSDHRVRVIWSDDAFRQKLERATNAIDTERHAWQGFNFAVAPNPSLLQHVMLSAVDASTNQIAGFCEVAMLPMPDETDGCSTCSPMITNLVTNPNYRRRGIATNLLKSARRYVRCCWGSCVDMTLGLYVERDNDAAKKLYSRQGFVEGLSLIHI